jgi:hypothetical protein
MAEMTDRQIIDAFTAKEAEQNATPQGADHRAILDRVARQAKRPLPEVRRIILDSTFTGPN